MSEVSRYLPLSQRPRRDESGVTGDWSQRLAAVLEALAVLVDDGVAAPDDVARLVWWLRANRRARLGAKLKRREPLSMSDDQAAVLCAIAADTSRRRPLADLAAAVLVTLDAAHSAQRSITIDPVSLGAVAVARALSAPLPVRAVLADVTLEATDGDWAVGHGRRRRAPGSAIVRFVYGRAPLPEHHQETERHEEPDDEGEHDG